MAGRTNPHDRCGRCRMKDFLCLCPLLPTLRASVAVEILLHPKESVRTTNTGRIAHFCLAGSTLGICDRQSPTPWTDRHPAEPVYIVYPSEDSRPLNPALVYDLRAASPSGRPRLLFVDASWKQAGRMVRHVAALARLPKIRLPDEVLTHESSDYRLRTASAVGGRLSTLECIAKTLTIFDGDDRAERELRRVQTVMSSRTLLARGKIDPERAAAECEVPTVKLHELKERRRSAEKSGEEAECPSSTTPISPISSAPV